MDVTQPVARTAFYCCLVRERDAERLAPVCGDTFASRFLDDAVRRDLAPLLKYRNPAASNAARHRIIDDRCRMAIAEDPRRRVILVGAGFDTRAYRLSGGQWFEFDDPALIAFKEARLSAASAPNPLVRTAVNFASSTPDEYLGPLAGSDPALVILEGVSMYLPDPLLSTLARAVSRLLPQATIVADLMSPAFVTRFSSGLHRELAAMGARFAERTTHPSRPFEEAGYRAVARTSIVERSLQAGTTRIPRWLLNGLCRELRDGYAVWEFARP